MGANQTSGGFVYVKLYSNTTRKDSEQQQWKLLMVPLTYFMCAYTKLVWLCSRLYAGTNICCSMINKYLAVASFFGRHVHVNSQKTQAIRGVYYDLKLPTNTCVT